MMARTKSIAIFTMLALLLAALPVSASHRDDEVLEPEACQCKASLKFAKPQIRFNGDGVLSFRPQVDIKVRSKAPRRAPLLEDTWTVSLEHVGVTGYASTDITPPDGVTFSGTTEVFSGPCGTKLRHKGFQLPEVTLTGLVNTLLQPDQELHGVVAMKARLVGCGFDEEQRQFSFRMREFGEKLRVKNWKRL